MNGNRHDVRNYITKEGRIPFREWLKSLNDKKTQAIIQKRIDRLHLGNFGDHKQLADNVYELRIHYGSGYRIYFGAWRKFIIILLCGGSKKGQRSDIQKAKEYFQQLKSQTHE